MTEINLFSIEHEARELAREFEKGNRSYVVDQIAAHAPAVAACMVATMVADWYDAKDTRPDFGATAYNVGYLVAALAHRAEEAA